MSWTAWAVTRVDSATVGSVDNGGFVVVLYCTFEVEEISVVHVIVAAVSVRLVTATPEICGAVSAIASGDAAVKSAITANRVKHSSFRRIILPSR